MKKTVSVILSVIIILLSVPFISASETEKCDHTYEVVYQPNTCTEDGFRVDKCTRCGDEKNLFVFTAFGHQDCDYDNLCDRCGRKETNPIQRIRNFFLRLLAYITDLIGITA